MLWTHAHTGTAYHVLSLVLSLMVLVTFAGPGVAVFADEATSTPIPETVVEEVPVEAPEPDAVGDLTEPESVGVPVDEPEQAVVEESSEVTAVEPDPVQPGQDEATAEASEETGAITVAPVTLLSAAVAVGPRDDFPPPVTVGEGCDLTTIATFWAGQNTDAGSVSVNSDETNLYVTFQTTGGWTMSLTHLYVGLVPPASYAPGSFPYQTTHNPAVTSYTYTIPLADIGAGVGDTVYIAAHAEVSNGQQNETAWAGQGQWPGLLFTHVIQDCIPKPVPADITVVKFNDLNENGVLDEGEPFIEGVKITIAGESYDASATTDASGTAVFGGLDAGSYQVDEVVPGGWFATIGLPIPVELAEGQNQTVYIGNAEEELPFTYVDLGIDKQADVESASAGDIITYTLTYRNLGNIDAYDFTITDDFDESLVEVVDSGGGTVTDGTIVWDLSGPLSPDDGDQTITYTVRVLDPVPSEGARIDNVVVIFHPMDENPDNNTADETVTADPFLPFTPTPEPKPGPVPVVQPTTTSSPEPYLPFTGAEPTSLFIVAAMAVLAGLAIRRFGVQR